MRCQSKLDATLFCIQQWTTFDIKTRVQDMSFDPSDFTLDKPRPAKPDAEVPRLKSSLPHGTVLPAFGSGSSQQTQILQVVVIVAGLTADDPQAR